MGYSWLCLLRNLITCWSMEIEELKGHLILVVSVPGAGKSTLISHIRRVNKEISYAVSCTSRPIRPGEKDGDSYYFISDQEFKQRINSGDFLEWIQQDGGRYYGTLKSEIIDRVKNGEVVLREVEVRGAKMIKDLLPKDKLSVIFISAGTWEEMKSRITKRAPISPEELEHRRERYEQELLFANQAGFKISNRNGELEEAKTKFEEIIANIVRTTKSKL